jgi:hypothetical protein
LFGKGEKDAAGEIFLRHYAFHSEFLWNHPAMGFEGKVPDEEFGKSFTILDMKGLSLSETRGQSMKLVKMAVGTCSAHYPERAFMTVIINTPMFFSGIYKVISLMLDPVTRKKVVVFGAGSREIKKAIAHLHEHIDPQYLPEELGGTSVPFGQSPQDVGMREWVEQMLEEKGMKAHPVVEE